MNGNEHAKKGSHLSSEERRKIAMLYDEGLSPYKIGKILGRASNTIRNELKRGTTKMIIGYYEMEKYFPDTGQAIYENNRKRCRKPKKIESCQSFIKHVEKEVIEHNRSFAAIRAEVLDKEIFKKNEICSIVTLYTYTDRNMLKIKNIDLTEKVRKRKRKRKRVKPRLHKRLRGSSISERPQKINAREEFGHWEIDLVIGQKTSKDNALLTLTERKTKKEIIRRIKGKTVDAVHRCLKKIKKETYNFDKIFKSITTDNGTEFARLHELGKRLGVDVYYAHPYSSWERGQNENTNRIIRRFIPKGEMIKNYSKKKIQQIEDWINSLYRKSLGWKTADFYYQEELKLLN